MNINKIRENKEIIERVEQFLQTAYENSADFNSAVNGDEAILISSIKDPQHQYRFKVSEILFWVDRDAYVDEFESWQDQQQLEKYKDTINFLKNSGQLPIFLDLADVIKKRRIAPFVGAGLSAPCGYPLWSQALTKVMNRLKSNNIKDIKMCIKKYDYLKAAQLLYDISNELFNIFIKTEFRSKTGQERIHGITGPVKLLPRISFGCVITTNLDEVIEQVFKIDGDPLDGYMHGIQPGNNFIERLLRGERCILKLHGNYRQASSYVFTEEQYLMAYGNPLSFELQLPRALRQIFISHSLLFIGCSLEQDKTLELFQAIVDTKDYEIPDHYAILPELPNKKKDNKNKRLSKLNIHPIWYPEDDTHSYVEKLLDLAVAVVERRITIG